MPSEPLLDLRPDHLKIVLDILQKHVPDREVWAFGSRAKWTAKDASDLDLCIVGDKPLDISTLARLKDDFSESNFPFKVDVIDWATTSEKFRKIIEEQKIILHKGNESNGRQKKKLCEIAEIIGGGTPSTKNDENFSGDIPWLTPKDLSGYQFKHISKGERNISEKGLKNSAARLLPKDTILLTSRAPIGYVAIAANPIATNQGFKSLILKEGYDPDYIYYLLKSSVDFLKSHASGTTFLELSGSALREIIFEFPDYDIQKKIGQILSSIDNKIELNHKMNETLEATARAIFKSWFIDFDPVRAKAEGRQPFGMDSETAALFPDSFEESELGMIPRGWEVKKIDDEFILLMGQSPPGNTYNESGLGVPLYQGKTDFGFRFPTNRIFCTKPGRLAKTGDTLVSVRAPVGAVNLANEECCIGRGVASIRHRSGSKSYTYYSMKFLETEFSKYEKEGTVFGSINKKNFQNIIITSPSSAIIDAFEESIGNIDQLIEINDKEKMSLEIIRNALLPKLMSGTLTVAN